MSGSGNNSFNSGNGSANGTPVYYRPPPYRPSGEDVISEYSEYFMDSPVFRKSGPALSTQEREMLHSFFDKIGRSIYMDIVIFLEKISCKKTSVHVFSLVVDCFGSYANSNQVRLRGYLNLDAQKRALDFLCIYPSERLSRLIFDIYRVKTIRRRVTAPYVRELYSLKKAVPAALITIECELNEFRAKELPLLLFFLNKEKLLEKYFKVLPDTWDNLLKLLEQAVDKPAILQTHFGYDISDKELVTDPIKINRFVLNLQNKRSAFDPEASAMYQTMIHSHVNFIAKKYYREHSISRETLIESVLRLSKSKQCLGKVYHTLRKYGGNTEINILTDHYSASEFNYYTDFVENDISKWCTALSDDIWYTPSATVAYEPLDDTFKFPLDRSAITIIDNNVDFEAAINDLSNADVVGVDAEWPPTICALDTERIAVLQVAKRNHVYVMDVNALEDSEDLWIKFCIHVLNSTSVMKLGYGVVGDMKALKNRFKFNFPLSERKFLDLNTLTTNMMSKYDKLVDKSKKADGCRGLSKVFYQFCGKKLSKLEQMSDWNRRPLRNNQLIYAVVDAYCLIQLFDEIQRKCEKYAIDFMFEVRILLNTKRTSESDSEDMNRVKRFSPKVTPTKYM